MILNTLRDIFPRSGWKSFLKGRAKSTAESLLMMPNTLAMGFTLATPSGERTRERLRGRGKTTLTALPERVKKVGQKRPQAFLTHK